MSVRQLDFSRPNLVLDMAEVKQMFRMDWQDGSRRMLKQVLERMMADDLYEHVQAGWNQRVISRRGYRNGYRSRRLLTSLGAIDLAIPRVRDGRYYPDYLEEYKRVSPEVDEGIKAMFLRGVSTHKVGEVLDALCGYQVSAGYVSKVTKGLDELVRQFENSPISDDFAFLFIDGINIRVKYELKAKRMVLLVVYGIRRDGSRRLISFRLAKSESRANYLSFLENLKARGLKGQGLELIIMDGSLGLWSAIEEVYPDVPHQLCWVHKLRNVGCYCSKKLAKECCQQASQIMRAKSPRQAANLFRQWKANWQYLAPRAVKCLENDFDKLIPVFEFDSSIHKIIRTTNVIERCFREVRRRLKVMGSFPDSKSCKRITVSLFEYFNHKWSQSNRRLKPIAKYRSEVA